MSKSAVGAAIALTIASAIGMQPNIGDLDATGQAALAIIALAVGFWVSDVLNAGITALLALGLLVIAGVPSGVALSGFATGAFWILVCVLFFGTAMDKTGLARRIAYRILLTFPPTYAGLLGAFMLIGFVLTFGIPSMTVRTAIMVPIAFALVQAVGLPLPGRGAALIVLSTFEMAVLPGCAILTGSLWGPFLTGVYATAGVEVTWLGYALVMAIPTVVWCALVLAANLIVLRPPPAAGMHRDVVRAETAKLGRLSRGELVTATVVGVAILAWTTQPWHGVAPEAIAMVALAALFAGGVLGPGEIGTGIPWALAIFVGGMLSLTTVMTNYGINDWLGGYLVPLVRPVADSPMQLVAIVGLAVAAMRFVDPVGFITIAAFLLTLVGFVGERGVPPLVFTAMVLLPIHIFWFNYQNIWIVMTEGITRRTAYTDGDRYRLATAFFGVTVAALWIGLVYWRAIGILR